MWDSHSHLFFLHESLHKDYIFFLKQKGVKAVVMASYDSQDWSLQLELKKEFKNQINLYTFFGIHPWSLEKKTIQEIQLEIDGLKNQRSQASGLGEVGLDKSINVSLDLQLNVFQAQLDLNQINPMPVVLHHHGYSDVLEKTIKNYTLQKFCIHGFYSSLETLKRFLDRGVFISIGPSILNPKFKKYKEIINYLPLSRILIESDWPNQPDKNSENQYPFYLSAIAQKIIEYKKNTDGRDLINQIVKNSEYFFL
jgi:TatD DNase family protein